MTQDKRELLELAARAAGYDYSSSDGRVTSSEPGCGHVLVKWDPTESDGDCARLKAVLQLDVNWCAYFVYSGCGPSVQYADHNNDRQTARKWASTKAAAEVGRNMK